MKSIFISFAVVVVSAFAFSQVALASVEPAGAFVPSECGSVVSSDPRGSQLLLACVGRIRQATPNASVSDLAAQFEMKDGARRLFRVVSVASPFTESADKTIKNVYQLQEENGSGSRALLRATIDLHGRVLKMSGTVDGAVFAVPVAQPMFVIM